MAVLLITEPSGARLPRGNVIVLVSPAAARLLRRHDHVVGIDAVLRAQALPQRLAPLGALPPVERPSESARRTP